MTRETTLSLIRRYYDAFNAGDPEGMLACLTDDIEHRVNEGGHRIGKAKFREFCSHMGVSYREQLQRPDDLRHRRRHPGRRRSSWSTASI